MTKRLALRIAWQAAVTAVFAVLAARLVEPAELLDALREAHLAWVAPALLLFTTAKLVDSFRWRYLLRGVGPPPQPALFGAFLIGNMVNNLLPLRAGDLAKIQVLSNRYGTSRAGLAGSVFVVEATLDGVVFVAFVALGVAFLGVGELPRVTSVLLVALAAGAMLAFAAAILLRHRGQRLPLPARFADTMGRVQDGLHALGSVRRAAGAIALSLPAWLLESGVFALMGQAFGLAVPFPVYIATMVAANLAVAVPLGLWNLGPYEALVSGALVLAGVPDALAFSYALTTHLLVNIWINVTGLLAFWALGIQPRELLSLRGTGRRANGRERAARRPT